MEATSPALKVKAKWLRLVAMRGRRGWVLAQRTTEAARSGAQTQSQV